MSTNVPYPDPSKYLLYDLSYETQRDTLCRKSLAFCDEKLLYETKYSKVENSKNIAEDFDEIIEQYNISHNSPPAYAKHIENLKTIPHNFGIENISEESASIESDTSEINTYDIFKATSHFTHKKTQYHKYKKPKADVNSKINTNTESKIPAQIYVEYVTHNGRKIVDARSIRSIPKVPIYEINANTQESAHCIIAQCLIPDIKFYIEYVNTNLNTTTLQNISPDKIHSVLNYHMQLFEKSRIKQLDTLYIKLCAEFCDKLYIGYITDLVYYFNTTIMFKNDKIYMST